MRTRLVDGVDERLADVESEAARRERRSYAERCLLSRTRGCPRGRGSCGGHPFRAIAAGHPSSYLWGMAKKDLRCRLGIHSWENHRNEEGQRYITCRRCGRDGDKITMNDSGASG